MKNSKSHIDTKTNEPSNMPYQNSKFLEAGDMSNRRISGTALVDSCGQHLWIPACVCVCLCVPAAVSLFLFLFPQSRIQRMSHNFTRYDRPIFCFRLFNGRCLREEKNQNSNHDHQLPPKKSFFLLGCELFVSRSPP